MCTSVLVCTSLKTFPLFSTCFPVAFIVLCKHLRFCACNAVNLAFGNDDEKISHSKIFHENALAVSCRNCDHMKTGHNIIDDI